MLTSPFRARRFLSNVRILNLTEKQDKMFYSIIILLFKNVYDKIICPKKALKNY